MVDKLGPTQIVPVHRPRPVPGEGEQDKPPKKQPPPGETEPSEPGHQSGDKGDIIDEHA